MNSRISPKELEYVKEVLEGGFSASHMGKMTTRLEHAWAQRFGVRYAIAHTNGTATLHSAIAAAGISPGDEVIVPPLTMASTTLAVLYEGGIPVFCDVDPDTYCMDPASMERMITEKTKAVIPVALYGQAPDLTRINHIARQHGLTVIEDNAQCYLGEHQGKIVGSQSHLASFSLQGTKHITSGEGGMVLTDDETLADKVRQFSIVGYDIVSAKSGMISKDVLQDPDFIRHTSLGFKYKMSDLCAAVALGQLENIVELVSKRQYNGKILKECCKGIDWLSPQKTPDEDIHSFYTFAARLHLDQVDFSWQDFRHQFIKFGGKGFYAAWRLTFDEPMWTSSDHRIRQVVEKYSGHFVEHHAKVCKNARKIQPQIIQMKTNSLNTTDAEKQAEILAKTIRFFAA